LEEFFYSRSGETDFPEKLWMLRTWRRSRPSWMGPWAAGLALDIEVGSPACSRGLGA